MTSLSGLVSSYKPAMMKFDGSTGYYSITPVTTANNYWTCVARIGGISPSVNTRAIFRVGTTNLRVFFEVVESDDANIPNVLQFRAWENSTNTVICQVASNTVVTDGGTYTIFIDYNATAGTASMYINGVSDMDTGYVNHTISTGTLTTGTANPITVGGNHAGALLFNGSIGFLGYADVTGLSYSDFMYSNGNPKPLDEVAWREWGGQPLFWNPYGFMEDNKGSAGSMTKNGAITVAYGNPVVERVPTYKPAMMQFDGSTGYYNKSYTSSGNKVTVVIRFKIAQFTGGSGQVLAKADSTYGRFQITAVANDHATTDRRNTIHVTSYNTAGTQLVWLFSNAQLVDDTVHTLFYAFDGDAGTAIFYVDGVDADDTGNSGRIAPTTGTLETASTILGIGAFPSGSNHALGDLGFFGYRDAYLTNWSDFMDGDGNPRNIEASLSTVWGGTPLFWNPTGYMEDNKGSAGNMVRNGNIVVADNDQTPIIPTYTPAMMNYNGSSYYRRLSTPVTGNKISFVGRIKVPEFAGTDYQTIYHAADATHRYIINVYGSGHSLGNKLSITTYNSSVSIVCQLFSTVDVADDAYHMFLISYDGDNALATFIVDGQDVDNTGHGSRVLTTGTLETGNFTVAIGRAYNSATQFLIGDMGYVGIADAYLTNWQDFMDVRGDPKPLDESTWTEFGSQPIFWNEHGDLENNLGSVSAPANVGVVIGKGGN